jgi:ATP-dependent helicase/nuclease subunit A
MAVTNGKRREAESATDIAHGRAAVELPEFVHHGLAKQPRDLELPAWAKGRYGTALGRAVHAVLQTVDLTTGAGVDELRRGWVSSTLTVPSRCPSEVMIGAAA